MTTKRKYVIATLVLLVVASIIGIGVSQVSRITTEGTHQGVVFPTPIVTPAPPIIVDTDSVPEVVTKPLVYREQGAVVDRGKASEVIYRRFAAELIEIDESLSMWGGYVMLWFTESHQALTTLEVSDQLEVGNLYDVLTISSSETEGQWHMMEYTEITELPPKRIMGK